MRSRTFFFALLFVAGSLALPFIAHAAIPFFGPIIDKSWVVQGTDTQCALGWGAVIMVINNIISLLITLAIVFVAPVMIAYAGFLYVVNPVSPTGKEKAKGYLWNTVIGIIVALAGWLIVDAVMVVLTTGMNGPTFARDWSSLIFSNSGIPCIEQKGVGTGLNQAVPSVSAGGGVDAPSQNPNNTCTVAALASVWGANAAAMSCVTKYENTPCDYAKPSSTDKTTDGKTASWGIYQINISGDDLNYSECKATNGGQSLNCTKAFSSLYVARNAGNTRVIDNALYMKCVAAASNIACNTAAAKKIFNDRVNRGQNPLSAWGTAASNNCSSLLATMSPLQSFVASVLSSFERLYEH